MGGGESPPLSVSMALSYPEKFNDTKPVALNNEIWYTTDINNKPKEGEMK